MDGKVFTFYYWSTEYSLGEYFWYFFVRTVEFGTTIKYSVLRL